MRQHKVTNFSKGVINEIEDHSIPDGAASNSLNWLTRGDMIEIRRGSSYLGTDAGVGSISGLYIATKADATQIIYKKNGKKLEYYDTVTSDWIEVGTDLFDGGEDDEVAFASYSSLAGASLWVCSPNTSLYKIMTANPGSYSDMYDATKNFKGYIKISQNRMWLWNRNDDKTGVYGSFVDIADYTTETADPTTSLTGTLSFKAGGSKRTCFGVVITLTVSGEVYTDDFNGILTGSLGGTGTINYTTGDYTLSNAGVGTADYQWEDSTSGGIADFTFSSPRTAGEGFVFRQDDGGGAVQNVLIYNDIEFCLHEKKTWKLDMTIDDTNATNRVFRERVGILNWQAAVATGDGIFYIDVSDDNKPKFRLLTLDRNNAEVIPTDVSLNVNLADYTFDKCCITEWGDYILFACRTNDSVTNNKVFAYHKTWKSLDILDFFVNFFVIYNGTLLGGDSITGNVWQLFSYWDDDDGLVNNYWIGGYSEIKYPGLKKTKKLIIKGLIMPNQLCNVYIDTDNSGFSLVGTIDGNGTYVDSGQRIYIGSSTIGSKEIGGGGDGQYAYNFEVWFDVNLSKFRKAKLKFEATSLGYIAISEYNYHDINIYKNKVLSKYL